MAKKIHVDVEIPEIFKAFCRKARFKVMYGGRGAGGKSVNVSQILILRSIEKTIRVLCCRENQNSIKESVHKMLTDTIADMGIEELFHITEHSIKCIETGSDFIFIGLTNNINSLKSYANVDIVWIEEAEAVSKKSLDVLTPTIRKTETVSFATIEELENYLIENPELNYTEYINREGLAVYVPSEIWITFNPKFQDDEVYKRFVTNTPDSCILIKATYQDNPFFPPTLRKEMEDDKKNDIEKYKHIWLGLPTGAGFKIYAKKYNKDVHVINDYDKASLLTMLGRDGHCFMGIDPHSSYFPAVLWMGLVVNEHGDGWDKIIYNEFPTYDYFNGWYSDLRKKKRIELSLQELAEAIYSYDGNEYGIQVKGRYVDTRYAKGSGGSNAMTKTAGMIETWKRTENGSMYLSTPHETIIDAQRQNVLTDLSYNKNIDISPFNKPKIKIAPWCKNTLMALENHRETLDGKHEDDKFKDFSDALRILYAGTINNPLPTKKKKRSSNRRSGWMG
jgi:hypothetical protein